MATPHTLTSPPGVALVGGGFIGPVHAEALRRIGVPVLGLLGGHPERARALADRLGIPRVYRDIDELLSDPGVQALHVASPNAAHFEQVRRALEVDKHVLCEKPLATTSAETAELVRLAAERPTVAAGVNYNVRFYPLAHEMRRRVASGDIGRVLSVGGSYTQDWLLKPTDYNWRVEPDGGAGLRAVADIGTHWMDLAQFVIGRAIESVCADLATFHRTRHRPRGASDTFGGSRGGGETESVPIATEDYAAILLRFEDDLRGAFQVSQAFAGRKNRLLLEIAGTEGSLTWDSERPDELVIGRRDRADEFLRRDPATLGASAAAISHYPGGHVEGFPDTFKQLFLAFYGWIGGDRAQPPPFPTFADGHREVLLCEAIARSARERAWMGVG
jgi:predicted dehydrogenase